MVDKVPLDRFHNPLIIKLMIFSVLRRTNSLFSFVRIVLQNHRMIKVGRDLWGSSGSTPLLRQGHLGQIAQDRVQMAFDFLQWWRLHNPFAEGCVPALRMGKASLTFRGTLPCFSLSLLPLALSLSTTKRSLAWFSLQHLFRYLYTLTWYHWAFFFQAETPTLSASLNHLWKALKVP